MHCNCRCLMALVFVHLNAPPYYTLSYTDVILQRRMQFLQHTPPLDVLMSNVFLLGGRCYHFVVYLCQNRSRCSVFKHIVIILQLQFSKAKHLDIIYSNIQLHLICKILIKSCLANALKVLNQFLLMNNTFLWFEHHYFIVLMLTTI